MTILKRINNISYDHWLRKIVRSTSTNNYLEGLPLKLLEEINLKVFLSRVYEKVVNRQNSVYVVVANIIGNCKAVV